MSSYDRPMVEHLLPTAWDSSFAFGLVNPTMPDPDMPKAKANPKHGNTLYAHIADIKSTWKRAYIPLEERQALVLRYGMGCLEREIGVILGVPRRTVSDRLVRGVGRIVAHLNGEEFTSEWVSVGSEENQ
ncbi:sigma factor-like helix-turn-helix DNA-binding protein [Micromonospora sp. NPDC048839]|uniref:sigma factor-like helix-turn-helix DNA-binding protein n=1 Tax=Micromonospora sp. NPDC048839 TaxID=3155641 RepID=UPI0033CF90F4